MLTSQSSIRVFVSDWVTMNQPILPETLFWTVSELNRYIHQLLEGDALLADIWVQGEISNLARPTSGHVYFTIKDKQSALKAVMWRSTAQRQRYQLEDGISVELHGSLGVYEAGGQYQLYVDLVRPLGLGDLFRQFILLKEKLESEGLFDPAHKREIPLHPKRIGVVTSPTGAALRDILHTLQRRYPLAEVILAASAVQGEEAPGEIVAAIQALNRYAQPDVILLGRGGGSIEDLWAFNDESVARAIYASKAPIITGIGHETDTTIADFVSDLRAPTPTAAAERAVPNRSDLMTSLDESTQRLVRAQLIGLNSKMYSFDKLRSRLTLLSPLSRLRSDRQRLDELLHRNQQSLNNQIRLSRIQLFSIQNNLANLNPQTILQRGYAIIWKKDGSPLKSARQATPGEILSIQMSDGKFHAQTLSKEEIES